MAPFEIGLYSFVENTPDAVTGATSSPQQRMRELLEEIELADQVGLDAFGIGEHHRAEYLSSAPAVILAAAAARTKRIRLGSAVSVLSSDDPVRVFQQFSTLDLISGGRAEIIAGRGSFIESFPLFGYELDLYHDLFAEKIELLLQLRESERVTWSGAHRPAIDGRGVFPRPLQETLPIWIAVGGTPESVVRAAELGVPLAIAIIGGMWEQFAPFVRLYRDVLRELGRDPDSLPVSINSHGFLADDARHAMDIAWPAHSYMMDRIGRERGWSRMTRAQYEAQSTLRGANFIGSPQQIVDKMLAQHAVFGHQRLMLQLTVGSIPHAQVMRAIELLGTVVAPEVRKAIGT